MSSLKELIKKEKKERITEIKDPEIITSLTTIDTEDDMAVISVPVDNPKMEMLRREIDRIYKDMLKFRKQGNYRALIEVRKVFLVAIKLWFDEKPDLDPQEAKKLFEEQMRTQVDDFFNIILNWQYPCCAERLRDALKDVLKNNGEERDM